MIRYNPKEWFGLIFRFHKSDTFRKMFWVLFTYAIFVLIVVHFGERFQHLKLFSNAIQIHSLLGFVIGLLLVFRTNSAYDRWWEGRKLWGTLVNSSRNSALKFASIIKKDRSADRDLIKQQLVNFPFALKDHLREGTILEELPILNSIEKEQIQKWDHVPNAIVNNLFIKTNDLYQEKYISGEQLIVLNREIESLIDVLGACERIKNTPIPFTYNLFIKKFIFAYTMTLPFGLAFNFGYWSIPISCFILYIFGSLELLAEEIEDPFGLDSSDLPTDELSQKIQGNVEEIFKY